MVQLVVVVNLPVVLNLPASNSLKRLCKSSLTDTVSTFTNASQIADGLGQTAQNLWQVDHDSYINLATKDGVIRMLYRNAHVDRNVYKILQVTSRRFRRPTTAFVRLEALKFQVRH